MTTPAPAEIQAELKKSGQVTLSQSWDSLTAAAGPAAWWKLADPAGSATAADSSGNGHPGTATAVTFGNPSQAVAGNPSASFASASTSHILSSYNPALAAVTAECWVNLAGLSQSGNPRLIADSHTDADNHGFQLMISSGQPQFWVGTGTANINTAGGSVPPAGWAHLCGTWDGAVTRLYVNGVLVASQNFAGSLSAGSASGTGLGYNPAYNGDYLTGLLAECAVYPVALTAAQVAAKFAAAGGGGSGLLTFDPDHARQRWEVTGVTVRTSQPAAAVVVPVAALALNTADLTTLSAGNHRGASWSGNQDTFTGLIRVGPCDYLTVAFSPPPGSTGAQIAALAGVTAAAVLTGTKYTRRA